jgi:alanyl-tRNA synthetase
LRLDFAWNQGLSSETKSEIEEVANFAVRQDLAVSAQFMHLDEARRWGAIALFGETYDESVRVVEVGGPWSRELCGGTHVKRSSQIGLISLTGESSVGSGTRRLEAKVGVDAWRELFEMRAILGRIGAEHKVKSEDLEIKLANDQTRIKQLEKDLAQANLALASMQIPALVASAQRVSSLDVVITEVENVDAESLRVLAAKSMEQLGASGVVALLAVVEGKVIVMVAVSEQAQQKGKRAGEAAKLASLALGGGGGGKADLAQGGGPNVDKVGDAKQALLEYFR